MKNHECMNQPGDGAAVPPHGPAIRHHDSPPDVGIGVDSSSMSIPISIPTVTSICPAGLAEITAHRRGRSFVT